MKTKRKKLPDKYFLKNGKLIKQRCGRCRIIKDASCFTKNRNGRFGYGVICKSCRHKEYLKNVDRECRKSRIQITKLRYRAFLILSNGKKPKCCMSKVWHCCGDKYNGLWLSIDHVKGDGADHKREINSTSSTSLYRWIIKHPNKARERLQILCMNAQTMKRRVYGEGTYRERGKKYIPRGKAGRTKEAYLKLLKRYTKLKSSIDQETGLPVSDDDEEKTK